MLKRTPDQAHYWSETNKIIGEKLRAYYQACTAEKLPPQLLALVKKIQNEAEFALETFQPLRENRGD